MTLLELERQTDRQTDTDRQTERQTDTERARDKQTNRDREITWILTSCQPQPLV